MCSICIKDGDHNLVSLLRPIEMTSQRGEHLFIVVYNIYTMSAYVSHNSQLYFCLPHRKGVVTTMNTKVYRSELTPVSFLERSALIFPHKTAIVYGDRRYTYREFAERVYRLASHLRTIGLHKHDRVAFLCPNTPPMLEAHYAIPAAGGILVAINTRLN